jgi:hypothetical protein
MKREMGKIWSGWEGNEGGLSCAVGLGRPHGKIDFPIQATARHWSPIFPCGSTYGPHGNNRGTSLKINPVVVIWSMLTALINKVKYYKKIQNSTLSKIACCRHCGARPASCSSPLSIVPIVPSTSSGGPDTLPLLNYGCWCKPHYN